MGKAWAATDEHGRLVTVAVLDAAVAETPGWREAFAAAAESLGEISEDFTYTYADFSAAAPWVAYPAAAGSSAEMLFRALGVDYTPVPTSAPPSVSAAPTSAPPVSGIPQQVSGPPIPVSGAPEPAAHMSQVAWAAHSAPVSGQPAATQPAFEAQSPAPVAGSVPPQDPFGAPGRRIQPSEGPKQRIGPLVAVIALILVAVIGSGVGVWAVSTGSPSGSTGARPEPTASPAAPGLKPWAEAMLHSPEERALATAAPSMVFVEVILTGYVRNKQGNTLLRQQPVTFNRRCTGFVVNHDGHVLTNGQCVQPTPDIMLSGALSALANALVSEGTLKPADVNSFTRSRMKTTAFTGESPSSPPEVKVYGQLNVAKGSATAAPAIGATVVKALPLEEGNLAVVKLAQENLPVAEVNTGATIAEGSPFVVMGYNTSDTNFRDATYTVVSKPVTVTSVGNQPTGPIYRINEDIGIYSRGGIAMDAEGRVIGMLDNDILRPDRANRVVVPVSTMVGLLSAAGVNNSLGEADRLYRSGLEAYFKGDLGTAIDRFDQSNATSPANALAQAYRQAAVDSGGSKAGTSERPAWAVPLLAASGAIAVVGLAVLVVLIVRRRRGSWG
ncbi:trypsin-like peptidase domain-containing protein [Micromonospora avicenniae]|uniref:trypsin-like peptidase domain-containing protein n=1 Tax=Micromonospora avicenniae TaxID=1198245 RepID=UPI00097105F0|nr:trypsin-like peptidase domain-containing protein [Micromonospora avicenniae]